MEGNGVLCDHLELEEIMCDLIHELRKLLQEKYKITVPIRCNDFLARCIRLKDGNTDKSAKLVQAFYTAIPELSKWQAVPKPSEYVTYFYQKLVVLPLKNRNASGCGVMIARASHWDPYELSFEQAVMAVWLMNQYGFQHDLGFQRHGVRIVWDFTGVTAQQIYSVKYRILFNMSKWCSSGVLGKFKGFHVVNHPKVISLITNVVKPFLSKKMRNRILFHGSLSDLHASLQMEPKFLPKFLGGEMDEEECTELETLNELGNNDAFFHDMLRYGFPAK